MQRLHMHWKEMRANIKFVKRTFNAVIIFEMSYEMISSFSNHRQDLSILSAKFITTRCMNLSLPICRTLMIISAI